MDAFSVELLDRSPLAAAALELADYGFDRALLRSLFEEHRGRCYRQALDFPDLVELIRLALTEHDGSAHRMYLDLEARGDQPVDASNFYRKLARTPAALSEAVLSAGAARLGPVMPEAGRAELPACFDRFTVIAGDGKKVKNVAKRLLPTRGRSGALLGAKALVALDLRTGLVRAMSSDLDGETNDIPLVPALVEQLHTAVDGPMLSVWDRQFSDTATMDRISSRQPPQSGAGGGDRFVVRVRRGLVFTEESAEPTRPTAGPDRATITDQIGWLGRGRKRRRLRRVSLQRPGEPAVTIVTDLLDARAYPAADLLELYRRRWGIEAVFQQVTETFGLSKLIGAAPRAVLLQLSVCLMLYNLLQVIRAHVADGAKMLTAAVSMAYLFDHTRRQLLAWAYHGGDRSRLGEPSAAVSRGPAAMRQRLRELLTDAFDVKTYAKRPDPPGRRPRPQPRHPTPIPGGHTSVQRLLQATPKP